MSKKRFRLQPGEIVRIVSGYGSCLATDRITVDGARVGYMYREEPNQPGDSGWRFFAGDEDEDYVDDQENIEMYDVNTIVNYDRAILPYLDAPVGSRFELEFDGKKYRLLKDGE